MTTPHHRFSRDVFAAESGRRLIIKGREYNLAGKIGDGAIGLVRRVVDLETERHYAVKFLAPEMKYIEASSLEDIHARFKREGQRGLELGHENLLPIFAYEENENGVNFPDGIGPENPFILMELVQGKTLESFIRHQQPSPALSFTRLKFYIAYQVANALTYLHARHIVHRDVKPANIFISKTLNAEGFPRFVKLGDFGIVKWGDFKASISSGTITMSGQQGLGTMKYMPPEQAINPKEVDVKADMYSFGATLFELFSNQILPNVFHVMQLRDIRQDKASLDNKLNMLGLVKGVIPPELRPYEHLIGRIFDCFLRPSGRPSSREVAGNLKAWLDDLSSN